jgi:tetratricopeptide (TPR) repeat protein
MKKTTTLLALLFFCLSLSAFAQNADTIKMAVRDTFKQNSPKPQELANSDSVKLVSVSVRIDSVNFVIAAHPKNNFSLTAIDHFPRGLNFSMPFDHKEYFGLEAITHYADSLNLAGMANHTDNLSYVDPKFVDSLRFLAKMAHLDSIKFRAYRALKDTMTKQLTLMSIDSLKLQLKIPEQNLFKGPIYSELATRYLDYDTLSNKATRLSYQNKVLNYTMLALHQYSYFNDTAGLRTSFDHLAKVYMAQKKFSQAKWFILQSNSLSRAKNDPANIIASLITLSTIKSELNDYTLAMRDLNEALQISITGHYPKLESEVLKNYALLYSRLKNYPKEELVLKKRDSVEEGIRKDEEAKMTAALITKDSTEKKKADSVQTKKKVLSSNTRKLYKSSSTKKVDSL